MRETSGALKTFCLDLGGGNTYTCKNSSNCTLKIIAPYCV